MAIAINLELPYDIETYDGLIAYVTAHLELDAETVTQLPTLVRKAEYRLNRLVVTPERETSTTLTTVAAQQAIALPTDFRQLKNLRYMGNPGYTLEPVTLDVLHDGYTSVSGVPYVFAISESNLNLGPVPDGAYSLSLTYIRKIPGLSESNQTNWLLSTNADVYVYAVLWQTAAWLEDAQAAVAFRSEMMEIIDELNQSGNRYRSSAPMRLRSPVVV